MPELDIIIEPSTVGLENSVQASHFKIYPNPADKTLYLTFNKVYLPVELMIVNLTGEILHHEKFDLIEIGKTMEIDVSFLKKGTYILCIQSDNVPVNSKLMIQ